MENKIELCNNKTLKMINPLFLDLTLVKDYKNITQILNQINNYVKLKGVNPIGPLIQYTLMNSDSMGNLKPEVKFIKQCDKYILKNENPFSSKHEIKIKGCMFAHYNGPGDKLGLAYDKINVFAFENNIKLKGDSYTVFLDKDDDDNIVADIFMEKEENE